MLSAADQREMKEFVKLFQEAMSQLFIEAILTLDLFYDGGVGVKRRSCTTERLSRAMRKRSTT